MERPPPGPAAVAAVMGVFSRVTALLLLIVVLDKLPKTLVEE